MSGLLEFTMASYSGFAVSASCASLTTRLNVFLHSWPVDSSLYKGSSPHHSLMSSHGVMVACLENLGSERLGGPPLAIGGFAAVSFLWRYRTFSCGIVSIVYYLLLNLLALCPMGVGHRGLAKVL